MGWGGLGGESGWGDVYTYDRVTFFVWQKPTQCHKAIIFQFKNLKTSYNNS